MPARELQEQLDTLREQLEKNPPLRDFCFPPGGASPICRRRRSTHVPLAPGPRNPALLHNGATETVTAAQGLRNDVKRSGNPAGRKPRGPFGRWFVRPFR